jgi:hypothetical protein
VSDSGGVKVYRNVMAWSRDGYAYIGGTRNSTNTGNEIYNNNIILGANDAGNKQILSGWLPQGDKLGSNIAHDNRYYYGGLQDGNATRKFQWNTTTYAKLPDYNATLGEESAHYLSAAEVQSILQAKNAPTSS